MNYPRISLEQWLAFKTVVDEGSFALAAEALNKSQSTVSYAVSRLNEQLPEPVLVPKGRKTVLSDTGKILYPYAQQLLNRACDAEAVAKSLAQGVEAEVTIAVDSLLNIDALLCAFETFSQQFPHTRLRLLETTLSGTTEALLERQADIVLSATTPVGLSSILLTEITMAPVAAPEHPLIKGRDAVSELELSSHRQVVLRDSGSRQKQDSGWLKAEQRWTVSHFASSIKILKSGLAFAILPLNWISAELASGTLQRIPLGETLERKLPLYLMLTDKQFAGPTTRALHAIIAATELAEAG